MCEVCVKCVCEVCVRCLCVCVCEVCMCEVCMCGKCALVCVRLFVCDVSEL